MPPGFVTYTQLHPAWHLFNEDKSSERLLFRRFAWDGRARNIFVLSCPKNNKLPITVEIIPPTSLADFLRTHTTAKSQASTITIKSEAGTSLIGDGRVDKIAAFLDFRSEDDFYKFLELTGLSTQLSYISVPKAKLTFGLSIGEHLIQLFKETFPARFTGDDVEQLYWQDVFIRCSESREH